VNRESENIMKDSSDCATMKSQKETGNNHETPSENSDQHLKIKVPAGSNSYLRIAYFLQNHSRRL